MENDGYVYLDVRTVAEFEAGHPAGAYNIPLLHGGAGGMTPNPDFEAVVERVFAKDTKLVLGCKAGGRSAKAAQALIARGFTTLVDQRAGWSGATDPFGRVSEKGWEAEGLPSSTAPTAGRSYKDLT